MDGCFEKVHSGHRPPALLSTPQAKALASTIKPP